jgi:hypothetical protein
MRASPYDPLKSKFTASCMADLCATYYSVITSFGNHWDEIRSNSFANLRLLPPARYGKPSAFRLFYLRRYIEKAIELAGFQDTLRLEMFALPLYKLRARCGEKLRGLVIDNWHRPPDHLELVTYVPASPPIRYFSVHEERARVVGAGPDEDIQRCAYEVEVSEHVRIKYVSRAFVYAQNAVLHKVARVTPSRLKSLALLTEDIESLNRALMCYTSGELTFENFAFHESTEANRLSELTFYAVEPLLFRSFKPSPDSHRQAIVTCSSPDDVTVSFRGDLAKVRSLPQNHHMIALSKRIWNSEWRFLLEVERVDEKTFREVAEAARTNFSSLKKTISFLSARDLLDSLPKQGEFRAVGELEPGHHVVHPDYGPGFVVGKTELQGHHVVEFQFMKAHFKSGRIFIPVEKKLPAYWSDLALLDT